MACDSKTPTPPAESASLRAGGSGNSPSPQKSSPAGTVNSPQASVPAGSAKVNTATVATAPVVPGYLLGDPPYVEGWDPEEETCVSGNWCGSAQAAMKVVRMGMETDLDPQTQCPKRLMGKKKGGIDPKDRQYKGLSAQWQMRGTFQPWRTQKARARKGKEEVCCYHWFNYCAGRPLDGGARTQWGRAEAQDHELDVCDEVAVALARAYWVDGDDEYDSVAAFARCTLELFALGAPAELIEASQKASLDELRHAQLCRGLSKRYHAHSWAEREPVAVQPRQPDLWELLVDTLREGCVGESIAALRAQRMMDNTRDPAAREVLATIAQDEAGHAALAWRIVDWGLGLLADEHREALGAVVEEFEREVHASMEGPSDVEELAGRLNAQALRRCTLDAWNGVVKPMLAARI